MNNYVKSIIVLTSICLVVAVLMAGTNMLTDPIIKANQEAAANAALLVVMPDGQGFEQVDLSEYELPETVTSVYREASGGYVVQILTTGYNTGLSIMAGISADGEIVGTTVLENKETPSIGGVQLEPFGASVIGKTSETIDSVNTVAGATKTTGGYKSAIKDALNSFIILNGGSVDLRTEEQILADNLNSALAAAGSEFEEIFIVEELTGIDAVYAAKNGAGYVYVIGESFIGIDADGNVISEADDSLKTLVGDAFAKITASKLYDIDITGLGLASNILSAQKTESGNYVFSLRASGFGINGDEWYNPSGEYIYISAAITADGRIISIKTTKQSETDGIGSACADESFYKQFVGKTEADYAEIDAISGATYTTDGYKTAVKRAIEAVKILEGVN